MYIHVHVAPAARDKKIGVCGLNRMMDFFVHNAMVLPIDYRTFASLLKIYILHKYVGLALFSAFVWRGGGAKLIGSKFEIPGGILFAVK